MTPGGGAVTGGGTRHSANVQNWSTGIKVAAILGMSLLLLGSGSGLAGVRAATFAAPLGGSLLSGIGVAMIDRKSTRLNSSHLVISYAVFCLKKKKKKQKYTHNCIQPSEH